MAISNKIKKILLGLLFNLLGVLLVMIPLGIIMKETNPLFYVGFILLALGFSKLFNCCYNVCYYLCGKK